MKVHVRYNYLVAQNFGAPYYGLEAVPNWGRQNYLRGAIGANDKNIPQAIEKL